MLPEQGERLEAFGGVTEELGLLGNHGNVVGRSIFKGEGEEALKAMGAVTYKSYVISLSNACHMDGTKIMHFFPQGNVPYCIILSSILSLSLL